MKPDLVNLPWATLLTLASGYAAYYIANVGVRDHHKAIDVSFSTLVFGFFSAFVYAYCRRVYAADILPASLFSFGAALAIGAFWSLIGRSALTWILRRFRISLSDDLPSAWVALNREDVNAYQLFVKLKDGTWLKCSDMSDYEDCANGPCVFGAKGDLLMYVTHVRGPNDTEFEACDAVRDPEWGDEITYIPADQIARVDYRRKKL